MKEIKKSGVAQIITGIGGAPSAAVEAVGGLLGNAKPVFDMAKQHFDVAKDAIRQDSESAKNESDKNRKYAAFAEEKLRDESLTDEEKKYWQNFYLRTFDNECDIRRESRGFKMEVFKDNKEIMCAAFSIVFGVVCFACGRQMPAKVK